jgi:hypothetical protein
LQYTRPPQFFIYPVVYFCVDTACSEPAKPGCMLPLLPTEMFDKSL